MKDGERERKIQNSARERERYRKIKSEIEHERLIQRGWGRWGGGEGWGRRS